jgi:hypothetical protein
MAETHLEAATGAPPIHQHRLFVGLRTLLGPLWRTTFRDPVRTGRLRLDGLSAAERQLARFGLVTLVLLLVSLLFMASWRQGSLVRLESGGPSAFVPEALVPVTLAAFVLALALIVWGALDAAPTVRLAVAFAYAGTVGVLDVPSVVAGDTWVAAHGVTVVRVAYAVPIAALLVSALATPVRRATRWLTPVLRAICLVAFGAMLTSLLLLDLEAADEGFARALPTTLHAGFLIIDGLLAPLVVVAAIAVVDFASDVSRSLAEPAALARGRLLWLVRCVLIAMVVAKLWVEVVDERDFWRAYLDRQAVAVVRTAAAVLVLVVVCVVVNRLAAPAPDDVVDEVKERLALGGGTLLSVPYLLGIALSGFGLVLFNVTDHTWLADLAHDYPVDDVALWFPFGASVLTLVGGCWLLQQSRTGPERAFQRELAAGLVVLGAWNTQAWAVTAADVSWGFSYETIDVLVTLGVLGWAVVEWRRLDAARLALLVAVLLFSWLVMSRGDYISFLGGLLGLPGVVVVVFGIAYTMASGAGFASESSRRLPRESRTLMFIGYLLLSVTILHWLEAVHLSAADLGGVGFHYIGIPLAGWLIARRIIPRGSGPAAGSPGGEPGPLPEEVGDRVGAPVH